MPSLTAVALLATASPTPFEVWSDLVLPTVVGVGSLAVALVAVFVAARSNRLARTATMAALRSNAIADRANRLEEDRDRREAAARELAEREAFADRWAILVREMREEIGTGRGADRSLGEGGRLILEGDVRGFAFPGPEVVGLLLTARDAHLGTLLVDQASAAAAALAYKWARKPNEVGQSISETVDWLERRVAEAEADAAREGEDAYGDPVAPV